ncbi:MAG: hypothetical protein HQ559_05930 [Lentisphaerae bacterium]|nr:hypothetical protein [Lentisphaerota bacterium]
MKAEEALRYLYEAFDAGRLAQAYLIESPSLVEACGLASRMAARVHCEGKERPCGACGGCRRVERLTHPDLLWVAPEKKSRLISVEQVRSVRSRVYLTSYTGGWKTVVLEAADRLGKGASNAFLKTLEEPPDETLFLLLTETAESILPTVLSRCQRVVLSGQEAELPEEWRNEVMSLLTEEPGGSVIAALSRGERLAAFLKGIRGGIEKEERQRTAGNEDHDDARSDARASAKYRHVRSGIVRAIQMWYRDILIMHCGAEEDVVTYRSSVDLLRRRAGSLTYREALSNVRIVEMMNRQLERNIPDAEVFVAGFSRLR